MVRSLPPWAAVALFALPYGLAAAHQAAGAGPSGAGMVLGMLVIVLAKVVGTAVVARLFTLTQPALMQLRWFAWTRALDAPQARRAGACPCVVGLARGAGDPAAMAAALAQALTPGPAPVAAGAAAKSAPCLRPRAPE